MAQVDQFTHGTHYAYKTAKCRCEVCRVFNRNYHRERGQLRRAQGFCWKCRRMAAPGKTFCEVHLVELSQLNAKRTPAQISRANARRRAEHRQAQWSGYPLGVVCALNRDWMR